MTPFALDCRFPASFRRFVPQASMTRLPDALHHVLHKKMSGSVTIVGVSDRVMRTLNRRYRGKDRTTDVLSFLYTGNTTKGAQMIIGDILLSIPEVRRQARERNVSATFVTHELIVHGLLHLLGYDHERSQRDEKIMFELQKKIVHHVLSSTSHP
ncbi:rRNA maturation RNase YbeY [Candidatus Uhrbacteria bacterium]|nr:rRNA maturation RNase YbeY [Candidatus Uhrbacteria bacterium]